MDRNASHRMVMQVPFEAELTFYLPRVSEPLTFSYASVTDAHLAKSECELRVDNPYEAHFIWRLHPNQELVEFAKLKPWQRLSHLPNVEQFDDKALFVEGVNEYEAKTSRTLSFDISPV